MLVNKIYINEIIILDSKTRLRQINNKQVNFEKLKPTDLPNDMKYKIIFDRTDSKVIKMCHNPSK